MALNDRIVGDLMARNPETVAVFVRRRMACPGCPMAGFMTVAEAAREHDIAPDVLVSDLEAAMAARETRP